MFDWVLNIVLVCSGDCLILIDLGVGDGFEYFLCVGCLVLCLEIVGIDFVVIIDIVIMYMYMDYVGGFNVEGVKVKLCLDVCIYVVVVEVEFWKNLDFSRMVMFEVVLFVFCKVVVWFVEFYCDNIVMFG